VSEPTLLAQVCSCLQVEPAKSRALQLVELCCRTSQHSAQRLAECGALEVLGGLIRGSSGGGGTGGGFDAALADVVQRYFPSARIN
jgi:hypothetical protein